MQPAFCGANPIVSSPRHALALSRCNLCCVALEHSVMPHQDPVPRGTLRILTLHEILGSLELAHGFRRMHRQILDVG